MKFSKALGVQKGLTAIIGSGGKTSLLATLAAELRQTGAVLLCTTTRMYPAAQMRTLVSPTAEEVRQALAAVGVVCIGTVAERGKLSAPSLSMVDLCKLADFVLVEADGSKGLPLKAHADYEPVIPPEAGQTICVVGLSGLGRPIQEAAHRPVRYAALAEAALSQMVTPTLAARVLNAERLGDRVLLNQADGQQEQTLGLALQAQLLLPSILGSLKENTVVC